jgi:uncharacterized protein YkwD
MRRPTRLLLAAAVAATTAAGLSLSTGVTTPASAAAASVDSVRLNGFEARLAADINAARRSAGLRPLVVVAGATDVARNWSWRMAGRERLWHNPSVVHDLNTAGSAAWTQIAENVGFGPADGPEELFQAYMNSPPHRANILDRGARYLGVGTVERDGVAWNTLDFVNAYSDRYGSPRVPAAGMTMDQMRITRTTDVAMLETSHDQRLTTRQHGSVRASRIGFTGPTSGNDAAFTVLRTVGRGSGNGVLVMRDALDLSRATALDVQLSAWSPTGRAVPVQVLLRRSFGSTVSLGTVWVGPGLQTFDLRLPAAARSFRNTVVFSVGGGAIRAAGHRVRLSLFDLRAAV